MTHLSHDGVLSMARDAMYHGRRQVFQSSQGTFLLLQHNQMMFTISSDCTSVISIQYLSGGPGQYVNPTKTNQQPLYNSCTERHQLTPTPRTFPQASTVLSVHGKALKA